MPVNTPNINTRLEDIQNRFRNAFGESFNRTPSTPNGQAVRIWTHNLNRVYNVLQRCYQSNKFNQAQGEDLTDLVALIGIARRVVDDQRSHSTVRFINVTLIGKANAVIPEGTVAITSLNPFTTSLEDYRFYLTSPVTLDESGRGVGSFEFLDDILLPEGEERQILTNINEGVLNRIGTYLYDEEGDLILTGVYNSGAGSIDFETESDFSLRRRSSVFINNPSQEPMEAIRQAMLVSPTCANAQVYMNTGSGNDDIPTGQPEGTVLCVGHWLTEPDAPNLTPPQRMDYQSSIVDNIALALPPIETWNGTYTDENMMQQQWGEKTFTVEALLPTLGIVGTNGGHNIDVSFVTAKQIDIGIWVELETSVNPILSREAILEFLWGYFDNPNVLSVEGLGNRACPLNPTDMEYRTNPACQSRGSLIGRTVDYLNLNCDIRGIGERTGLFTVNNVWLVSPYTGADSDNYTRTDLVAPKDTFYNFTNAAQTSSLPNPQLQVDFEPPDNHT